MNMSITDGLVFMPPPFANGLSVWSSEDGTAGSATYQGAPNAALVPADQDFGGCLEMQKTQSVQKLRYMGQTQLLPGLYLRISARIKILSGNACFAKIAGWAGGPGNVHVEGLDEEGPGIHLNGYGTVFTISGIVGTGNRTGVDMPWGRVPIYGHFGIDLTGANGAIVRIDDIVIEDVTSVFLRKMLDWVDVRDYGAIGNGVVDDSAAFDAADSAATSTGRGVLVSPGTFRLANDVSMDAHCRFEGQVTMPTDKALFLKRSFDFPTYAKAFGDEVTGFKKAFQALLGYTDHDGLDLCGRRIDLTEPIDMQAAAATRDTFQIRRVIRNGAFYANSGAGWTPDTVTSQASYSDANPLALTNVVNIANVKVGSVITGNGIGREVYVRAVNVPANSLTLSQGLYGAAGSQVYTFTRFKYILDFSGFEQLDKFILADVELQCNGHASGILLAPLGSLFQVRDCYVIKPKNRGITSPGRGCQDLHLDRCHFLSNEQEMRSQDRQSIAFNVNSNDSKIRDNRFMRFGTTAVVTGTCHMFVGNHWFQGDDEVDGIRVAGLVIAYTNPVMAITGNYIDNTFIEWTNEYEVDPSAASQFTFGALTITGNTFLAIDVAPWFSWLVIKPYGPGHSINGLHVSGNTFRAISGTIDRVDRVDSSIASLDFGSVRNVHFVSNSFHAISQTAMSPVLLAYDQATAATTWTINAGAYMPFGGRARSVASVVTEGMITGSAGERRSDLPFVQLEQGGSKQEIRLNWLAASKGRVRVAVRVDDTL